MVKLVTFNFLYIHVSIQEDNLGHAYTCILLKCGLHRRAKINETMLALPHFFCVLNNTFQNISF